MATTEVPSVQMVRWYTRARRFPQLIGKFPDGRRLPGGPYTITQVILGAGMIVGGLSTRDLWGGRGAIADLFLLSVITGGLVFAAGKIPLGGRNPAAAATGLLAAIAAPTYGRVGGRPVRLRPPTRLQHHVTIWDSTPTAAEANAEPATSSTAPVAVEKPRATPAHSASEAQHLPMPAPALNPAGSTSPRAPTSRTPLTGVQALLAARPAPHATEHRPNTAQNQQSDDQFTELSTRLGGR